MGDPMLPGMVANLLVALAISHSVDSFLSPN